MACYLTLFFRPEPQYWAERNQWRSWLSPHAPEYVATTGITQPPDSGGCSPGGDKLDKTEKRIGIARCIRRSLSIISGCITGATRTVKVNSNNSPWECGMDNTPPWIYQLHQHQLAWWFQPWTSYDCPASSIRCGATKSVPAGERFNTIEALALLDAQLRPGVKPTDTDCILDHALFSIEDVGIYAWLFAPTAS